MIDLVAIGHVTFDETPSGVRPGGSAYYAALTARRLGLSVGLLTSTSSDYPLEIFPDGIHLTTVASPQTTRYRLGQSRGARTLTLLSRAADLETEHLPAAWRGAPLAMLCPVAGEVDPALAGAFEDAAVAVLPQGWMRKRGRGGLVGPQPWEDADDVLSRTQLLVLSEEDLPGGDAAAVAWLQQVPLGAITRGKRGATLFVNGDAYHVEADAATEVDPTGAGDVFASTLLIEYQRLADAWEAAAAAACAGAASVEAEGTAAILDRAGLDARLATYRRRRGG
ncbi:MAG: ribokinase [Candidatus Rokubacteria bacterium]|nr:ribokinase [Candidatus Rokubacteria bacterium]